jgi:hypothetical protein
MKLQKFVFTFIGIILALVTIAIIVSSDEGKDENIIKGIEATDIYLNLEKENFTINRSVSNHDYLWICKKELTGISFEVSIYANANKNIKSIRATGIINSDKKDIVATQQFLLYLSSIPYTDSNPEQAASWLKDNFKNDKASIIIGNVNFTILAPSRMVRILNIEAVNPQ